MKMKRVLVLVKRKYIIPRNKTSRALRAHKKHLIKLKCIETTLEVFRLAQMMSMYFSSEDRNRILRTPESSTIEILLNANVLDELVAIYDAEGVCVYKKEPERK